MFDAGCRALGQPLLTADTARSYDLSCRRGTALAKHGDLVRRVEEVSGPVLWKDVRT